jgi:6-phosphogluconate dehydrogenase|tara:strand:- start:1446 stop:2840 length:1395 start_codon:yes stop_codon:yes gene_type:complete
MSFDFGLVGLGVMGRNFILNVAENGFSSLGLSSKIDSINILKEEGKNYNVDGTQSDEDFIGRLSTPRKIMLLVPAGTPVDSMIERFLPFLEKGDLIIDGGNSHFDDTERRFKFLNSKNINFIGAGVSGGSKGARFGPSIMPGGNKNSYEIVRPIFESAAAKVNGSPCVAYMGNSSSGHYVKMIHNGIEYAMMQLISESYDLLKNGLKRKNEEIHDIFFKWNETTLNSYLIEITKDIFSKKDTDTDNHMVDMILDKAKQKGTGKWTSQSAMDLGINIPTIDSSVSMRIISSFKDQRIKAEDFYKKDNNEVSSNKIDVDDIEKSLIFGFMISFAQGMSQLASASKEKSYNLNFSDICKIWRGGCIIRAKMLQDFMDAFDSNPDLENLLFDENIKSIINSTIDSARKVSVYSIENEIPASGLLASISYFDSFKSGVLPMNLVQAQRDCFGEHTFERIDKEGSFHFDW